MALHSRRLNEPCRGQSLVEFSIVTMTFFLMTFAVIDFSWMMFNQLSMQDAVREAGRYAVTGNHLKDPKKGTTLSRVESINLILQQSATGAKLTRVDVSSTSGTKTTTNSAGGPGDTVNIKVTCSVPLLTVALGRLVGSDKAFHFVVSSTFKNEPFSPSQS